MDFRCFNDFVPAHIRQNSGQSLGEHTLARTGRPRHENVMSTGSRHFQSALHILLPLHICKIGHMELFCFDLRLFHRRNGLFPIQMLQQLLYSFHRIHLHTVRKCRFRSVFCRDKQVFHAHTLCRNRHRQCTVHRAHLTQQTQLTEEAVIGSGCLNLLCGRQQPQQHR